MYSIKKRTLVFQILLARYGGNTATPRAKSALGLVEKLFGRGIVQVDIESVGEHEFY